MTNYANGGAATGSAAGGTAAGDGSPQSATRTFWKHHLMLLQESAPKPRLVPATVTGPNAAAALANRPPYYGAEFHGLIARELADQLMASHGEGAYLVRESQRAPGTYTLCMRFDEHTKNYRLFYDGMHYVGEKRFESIEQLVADGLICMYLDKHASEYIQRMTEEANYEEAPYSQYQRRAKEQQRRAGGASSAIQQSQAAGVSTGNDHSSPNQRPQSQALDGLVVPQKAHRFKPHTFKAHFCDYCGNFMWGLVQQGLRCEDCGFAAHKKCSEKTMMDCQPDLKYVKRMFAVDLSTLCMAHQTPVPPVVAKCVAEVESRGLFVEGIYRISGSHEAIERLRVAFDLGTRPVDLSPSRVEDIHSVAGLLKLYLRQLPQPLVTFSVYGQLVSAMRQQTRSEYDRQKLVRRALEDLPPAHGETLRLLVTHLAVVAEHAAVNKMTVDNVATIFAPTVLCHASPQNIALALPQQEQFVLQYLIVNARKLFPQPVSTPTSVVTNC